MNIDVLFAEYAPRKGEAVAKAAVSEAAKPISTLIERIYGALPPSGATNEAITAATKHLAAEIMEFVPRSADKSAAIRCVRLVRRAMTVALSVERHGSGRTRDRALTIARQELSKAVWQAHTAIELADRA